MVTPDKEAAVLTIPKMYANSIIALYHSSLFTGHQGVIKTYLTINDKVFYTQPNPLCTILHKSLSYMPNNQKQKATK